MDSGGAAKKSVEKEITRGISAAKEVIKAKSKGLKLSVGWNQNGQPVDPNKAIFVSYIGVIARERVPITISDWRHVPAAIKLAIWNEIAFAFDIEESRQKFVLGEAGKLARNYRSYLSRVWVEDDHGNINSSPPAKYNILQDDWTAFLHVRQSEDFQRLSRENQERAKEPEYPYRKSRLGYAQLEQIEMKKREDAGSDCTDVTRALVWKIAHSDSNNNIANVNVKRVSDEIECLSQEGSHSGHERTRDDLLAKALKKKEHPGRVRGVGFGVSQKDYFSDPKPSKQMEIDTLKDTVQMLTQSLFALRREFDEHKASGLQQPRTEETVSLKDSCPEFTNLPEVVAQCKLSLSTPSYRVVAKGQMLNRSEDRTLHTRPLPTHLVKVIIDIAIEDTAPLPVPLDDANVFTVFEAVRYYVAWPKSLVTVSDASSLGKSKSSIGNNKSGATKQSAVKRTPPVAKPTHEDDRAADAPPADQRPQPLTTLEMYVQIMPIGQLITVDIPEAIMNIHFQEYLGREEISHFLRKEEIGASIIFVYIKCLWAKYVVPEGK